VSTTESEQQNPRRGDTDEGGFYIHMLDPGYPDEPWPGERRLGPYLTLDEASEQAAHDLATGYLSEKNFVGIYDEAGSVERLDPGAKVKSLHSAKKVATRSAEVRSALLLPAARSLDAQRAALDQLLPEGVSADDMFELLRRS
jgi:hypothetical protein